MHKIKFTKSSARLSKPLDLKLGLSDIYNIYEFQVCAW